MFRQLDTSKFFWKYVSHKNFFRIFGFGYFQGRQNFVSKAGDIKADSCSFLDGQYFLYSLSPNDMHIRNLNVPKWKLSELKLRNC